MAPEASADRRFRDVVERLRMPGMGTEVVAPLLSSLIHLVRPHRVLEIGMGHTTPFLARALSEAEELAAAEAEGLARKTVPYLEDGRELDEDWIQAEPALLVPSHYREPYRPRLVAIDDFSDAGSSAPQVTRALADLGLADRVTVVNADLRSAVERLPDAFRPIDFAWVDAWDCLYFFENCWELINPDGGIVVMHYLMTYPEGEAILQYIAESQRLRPGEFEVLSLLESHKLRQNSMTVLRRTSGAAPRKYADTGQRPRLQGQVRTDALALATSLAGRGGERPQPLGPQDTPREELRKARDVARATAVRTSAAAPDTGRREQA
ncbi:class I SAM-dependent methyltransferase [Streptomyces ficellus]|uniref:Class I SAM-dependent methyltransferase n=1 Tax=Streptomyces ficellus TaxID=1977088 RepID=A0ABT7YZZ1_9ACTN|nr:class I SAM-dependent methyltransferase [Streptomyces ficellus]MDN3292800.1 class I SAM-dependent methyltransferase [Streptomyces ficellus]